jgi:hypothetical protein
MDDICPPSTVYPFNGHEGGENVQAQEKLLFLRRLLG